MKIVVSGYVVSLEFETRPDGGLRIWSYDMPGLILSHQDPARALKDVEPAIGTIINEASKLGISPIRVIPALPPAPWEGRMSDIVEKLRSLEVFIMNGSEGSPVANEAAAYIERLEAALKPFADAADKMEKVQDGRPLWNALQSGWAQRNDIPLTVLNLRNARAALQTGGV